MKPMEKIFLEEWLLQIEELNLPENYRIKVFVDQVMLR
jgi:hypothetical protein